MTPSHQAKVPQWRRIIRFWIMLGLLCLAALATAEFFVRWTMPLINHQGTELALFRDHAFGDTTGWQPNATGNAFGTPVVIDELGFRKMTGPVDYRESWLLLGDSVTFGVGVNVNETFAGRLQQQLPDIKLWNTAVVGYSAKDYEAVLSRFKDPQGKLRRVVIFLCLNDIYPQANVLPSFPGAMSRLFGFLGRNSKLYLLLKNTFFDRSKRYFEADLAFYNDKGPEYAELEKTLDAIREKATSGGLALTVVILPYEYQLRSKSTENLRPQRMLSDFFVKHRVCCLDAYPWLAESGVSSKALYLYADAMHLSPEGHRRIYEHLEKELQPQPRNKVGDVLNLQ